MLLYLYKRKGRKEMKKNIWIRLTAALCFVLMLCSCSQLDEIATNIANEKTTTQMVDAAAKETVTEMGNELVGHSFYADYSTQPPRYCMLVEPEKHVDEDTRKKMIELLDEELKEVNEKYYKYRRWGMLSEPEILVLKEKTYWDYRESLRNRGIVLNQIKPVTVINSEERKEFFFSHVETENSLTLDEYRNSKEKAGV